jgi:predicted DNA-binding protein (MmcQ/YjbR family)
MEEFAYEMSYLKAELQWHKETKQILLQLQEKMYALFNSLEDALSQATARLHESERQYLDLWQPDSVGVEGGYF